MEINNSLLESINNMLDGKRNSIHSNASRSIISDPVYSKELVLNIKDGLIQVPSYIQASILNCSITGETTFIVPLFKEYSSDQKEISGGEAIFKFLSRFNGRFAKVTSKENTYYGAPGIILDGNLNPIIEFGVNTIFSNNCSIRDKVSAYVKISNSIFLNQDNPVEKVIIKKVIPYLYTHNFTRYNWITRRYDILDIKVIITETFDNYIVPAVPSKPLTDKKVYNFLYSNIKDILSQIKQF